jgi:hypothetical protein
VGTPWGGFPPLVDPLDHTRRGRSKGRRSWVPWAAVVGVLVVMGNANSGRDVSVEVSSDDGSYTQSVSPAGDGPPGEVVRVTDPQVAPPLAADTALVTSAITSATTMLRVEVSTASPRAVQLDVSTDTGLFDSSVAAAPSAVEVHVSPTTRQLSLSVTDVSGEGLEAPLQCRIYVGHSLVAIGTGTGSAICDVSW